MAGRQVSFAPVLGQPSMMGAVAPYPSPAMGDQMPVTPGTRRSVVLIRQPSHGNMSHPLLVPTQSKIFYALQSPSGSTVPAGLASTTVYTPTASPSGHRMSVTMSSLPLEDQVKLLQAENNRLRDELNREKECIKCHAMYRQPDNGPKACRYHNGVPKFYSCSKCGGEKYYSCCNQCDSCNPGCKTSPHASYD